MISNKVKKQIHYVYEDMDEFRAFKPDVPVVEDWTIGEKGDWIQTDDGQVLQVLRRKDLIKKRKNGNAKQSYILTALGTFLCGSGYTIGGKPKSNLYSFGKGGDNDQIKRDSVSLHDRLYSKSIAQKMINDLEVDLTKIYLSVYPTNNEDYAKFKSVNLYKTDRIQKLIRKEVEITLKSQGVTPEYLIENVKKIIDIDATKDSDKINAIKMLMNAYGMFDKEQQQVTQMMFKGFDSDVIGAISAGSKRIEAGEEDTK